MTKEELITIIEQEFTEWWEGVKRHNIAPNKWGSYARFKHILESAKKLK